MRAKNPAITAALAPQVKGRVKEAATTPVTPNPHSTAQIRVLRCAVTELTLGRPAA